MYLHIPCYCDACLKSSALRVGVKTLRYTIQCTKNYLYVLINMCTHNNNGLNG